MPEEAKETIRPLTLVATVHKMIMAHGIEIFYESVFKNIVGLRKVEGLNIDRVLLLLLKLLKEYQTSHEVHLEVYTHLRLRLDRQLSIYARGTVTSVEDLR